MSRLDECLVCRGPGNEGDGMCSEECRKAGEVHVDHARLRCERMDREDAAIKGAYLALVAEVARRQRAS